MVRLEPCRRWPDWPRWAVIVVAAWLATVALAVAISHWQHTPVQLCLFRQITGLPCATCGMTRGCLAALQGDPVQAWLYNPLAMTALAIVVGNLLLRIIAGYRVNLGLGRPARRWIWIAIIVLATVNWAYVILYHTKHWY